MGPEKTMADLRNTIVEGMKSNKQKEIDDMKINQLIAYFDQLVEFEVPEALLQAETQNQADALVQSAAQSGMSDDEITEQREALLDTETLPGHHQYRDWILPLLQLPLWDEVQVIASERLSCCLERNLAGAFDGAYRSPALSERQGREVRVLFDLKTLSAHGRPYSTAAQLGGYMVLEAAHGQVYELGQTLWSKPGAATASRFYSREQCLAAWAAAWSPYCLSQRPF
jgi:hypothetical protein